MSAKRVKRLNSANDFSNSFYSDIEARDLLYAIIIRSSFFCGTINSITLPEDFPADYNFFTEKDIPGKNSIQTLDTTIPIFSSKKIIHYGESIGILTGKNLDLLKEIAGKIKIDFNAEKNTYTDSEEIFCIKDENIIDKRIISKGEAQTTFLNSEIKIEKNIRSKLSFTNIGETQGAIVNYDGKTLTVYAPTQWPFNLRKNLAAALLIKEENIVINKTLCDSFETNSLWLNALITAQVAIASYHLKKQIKLVFTREEQNEFIDQSMPVFMNFRISVDKQGIMTALNAEILIKAGTENPFIHEILDRMIIATCGVYQPEQFHLEAYALKSHHQPYSINLHWIDAQVMYGIETIIQDITSQLKISPIDFRLKNYKIGSKQKTFNIPCNTLPQVLSDVVQKSDFVRKHTTYSLNTEKRKTYDTGEPIRGMGIATSYEGSGLFGSVINPSNFSIEITMDIDNSIVIHAYTPSNSIQNIWKKIVSEILEVPIQSITLNSHFIHTDEPTLPETLNDNISIMTQLIQKCCKAIQNQRFRHPLPITIKRSFVPSKKDKWDTEKMVGTPFHSTSIGSVVAEIEINPCTYIEKIRGIWISIDGGTILDKTQATLSVKKGVQKVLAILHKGIVLDSKKIVVSFLPSEDKPKEIGELVYNMLPAAIGTAISNAFRHTIHQVPLEIDTIFKLIQTNEATE